MIDRRARWFRRLGSVTEACMILSSLAFLVTIDLRALVVWLVVGTLYVVGGSAAVWKGAPLHPDEVAEAPAVAPWAWIPPVLAAAVGAASAVMALLARNADPGASGNLTLVLAASFGVILSWIMLQVGVAQMYLTLDATGDGTDLRFPGDADPSTLDFLYFSFTLGTSFATSDVEIVSIRMRRLVLVHSVVAFFYNALVVAVAFQVLQGVVAG